MRGVLPAIEGFSGVRGGRRRLEAAAEVVWLMWPQGVKGAGYAASANTAEELSLGRGRHHRNLRRDAQAVEPGSAGDIIGGRRGKPPALGRPGAFPWARSEGHCPFGPRLRGQCLLLGVPFLIDEGANSRVQGCGSTGWFRGPARHVGARGSFACTETGAEHRGRVSGFALEGFA